MTHNLKSPQAVSPETKDHLHSLQSYHGAAVVPLSEVPQEGSSAFFLFYFNEIIFSLLPIGYELQLRSSKNKCLHYILFAYVNWARQGLVSRHMQIHVLPA